MSDQYVDQPQHAGLITDADVGRGPHPALRPWLEVREMYAQHVTAGDKIQAGTRLPYPHDVRDAAGWVTVAATSRLSATQVEIQVDRWTQVVDPFEIVNVLVTVYR